MPHPVRDIPPAPNTAESARNFVTEVRRADQKPIVPNGFEVNEDFATGVAIDDSAARGRPVGVTVDKDGALPVSQDAGGTLWRITYVGKAAPAR